MIAPNKLARRLASRPPGALRVAALVLLGLVVLAVSLWAFLALWFFAALPVWIRVPAALLWAASVPAAFWRLSRVSALRAVAAGGLAVLLFWSLQRPSNRRDWMPDQERMPAVRFDGETVAIDNVRHATYRSNLDFDVRWDRRHYDLEAIRTVDFLVVPFASWRGPAHTFLTFGFDDGRYVAISAEVRKEQGESYSPLAGLFRQYEIIYIVGDEQDLIHLRANVRKHPVYLFPIKARPQQVRAMFVSMLQRAERLRQQPEFYNTLANSCNTNIVRHFEEVTGRNLPLDVRILLPGYADELADELGLIDYEGTLEEARQHFRINGRSAPLPDGRAWSRQIREVQ